MQGRSKQKNWSVSALKRRGWTPELIKALLPEPQLVYRPNAKGKMRVWAKADVLAAEATGISTARKVFKHLIPNVLPLLIVQATLGLGSVILYESTLSYLGLGVPFPYAAWGTMIGATSGAAGKDILENYPNLWVPAGICIILAVLAFNFVGDGLRDAFDPKAKR